MNKKHLIIFSVFSILFGCFTFPSFLLLPAMSAEPDTSSVPVTVTHSEKTMMHLYFANKDNSFLIAEKKLLERFDDPAQMGKLIIESLIKGPKEKLMRTISPDAGLRALFVTKDKTAYVDLTQAAREKHPGGCKSEMITIYSIVNSLVLNIPEIDTVKILIDGRESMTLAGHIDLRFPLKADMLLVR
ncbi:MAG: GerMN domain-containing protein [Deltaproteobacteria bacterium]|nr:GerMN domain-containing protein [Deltaproteobacteria bacterium]